ncbi:MAG: DUF192 domain-containing protein [Arenimonas sp.]|nr:DUF192 domain-containing protein [Arenimonas sp.]
MTTRLVFALTLNMLFITSGCAKLSNAKWAEINGNRFNIEVADTNELRQRGLMFRRDMASDTGMLFIHDNLSPVAYWMKNTYIPLDILYFDEQLKLVSAQLNVPPCGEHTQCPNYPSNGPVKYVLEVNAGIAEKIQLKKNDQLILSESVMVK